MSTAKLDPNVLAHQEWIGFVRPTGLVVSPPALVRAGAILDRRDADGQLESQVNGARLHQSFSKDIRLPAARVLVQLAGEWFFAAGVQARNSAAMVFAVSRASSSSSGL